MKESADSFEEINNIDLKNFLEYQMNENKSKIKRKKKL